MPKKSNLSYKERRAILKQVNDLAWLLDNSIHIPLINYRIGLEAIIGLIPGLGDFAGLLLSSIIVVQAVRLGVPRTTLARMVLNIALEAGIGVIPLIGDLFDATFKANALNVQLINQAVKEMELGRTSRQSADQASVAVILGALVGLISVIGGVGIALFAWLFSRLRSKF